MKQIQFVKKRLVRKEIKMGLSQLLEIIKSIELRNQKVDSNLLKEELDHIGIKFREEDLKKFEEFLEIWSHYE